MFCTKCGSKLEDDARFCTVCGKQIVANTPVTAPVLPPKTESVEIEKAETPQVAEDAIPAAQAEPVVEETTPVVEETEPVVEETEPVVEETEPIVEETVPVVEDAEPVVEETEPVVEDTEPVVEDTEPVVEETEPVVEETEPVVEETEPVVEDAEPVVEETEPVVEEATPVVAAPPVQIPAPVVAAPVIPQSAPAAPQYMPVQKQEKKVKTRRKPHIVLRILMQLLSFVLCLVLVGSLVATVVLADLNHLRSAGGIKQLINAVLIPDSGSQSAKPHVGAAGVTIPGNVDLSDLPIDLLTGGTAEENLESLIEWAYEKMEESSDVPLNFSKEDVMEFVEESTVTDFIADKLASYTEDFINGTQNTTITADEIMDLIEDNEDLIEEKFHMVITPNIRETIEKNVVKVVEEDDLNSTIRVQVFESVEQTIDQTASDMGMSWEEIQPILQLLCADTTLYIAIGVCVLLLVLLCLLNYYNIPAGLTWFAIPSILVGILLTLPLVLLQTSPDLFAQFLPTAVVGVVAAFADVLLPIHATVLIAGLAVLVVSIFWRVIRSVVNRKRNSAVLA